MTTQANTGDRQQEANLPGYIAKTRIGYGKQASYERIGVAWKNDDGSFYVKLYGTQVVSNFTLYAVSDKEKAGE